MTDKLAFSPDEAAFRAGVGRTLIFSEIKEGRLVARKAGARTLHYRPKALMDWMFRSRIWTAAATSYWRRSVSTCMRVKLIDNELADDRHRTEGRLHLARDRAGVGGR